MKLSCDVVIKLDGETVNTKDIIEKAFSAPKDSIIYLSTETKAIKIPGKKKDVSVDGHELSTTDNIGDKYKFNGIYLIFSEDGTQLLYLGKGNAKTRLTQHLIKKADTNSSKMNQVSNYLKCNDKRKVQFAAIKVDSKKNTTAIESELIDFVNANKKTDTRFG